jgi:hypothetical protein
MKPALSHGKQKHQPISARSSDGNRDADGGQEPWVHLSCAYWLPELAFGNEARKEPVLGLDRLSAPRSLALCDICKQSCGGCVVCARGLCPVSFHVECARRAGLYLESPALKANDAGYRIYCANHRPARLLKPFEQPQRSAVEEIVGFCRFVERCLHAQARDEAKQAKEIQKWGLKVLRKVHHKKAVFGKQDVETLLRRVKRICKCKDELTLTLKLKKMKSDEIDELGRRYKLEKTEKTDSLALYDWSLDPHGFPWFEVKFATFTAADCYRKYQQLVPNIDAFHKRILSSPHRGRPCKSTSHYYGDQTKPAKEAKTQKPTPSSKTSSRKSVESSLYTDLDMTLYCTCKRMIHELPTAMIGTSRPHFALECSGTPECPGNGWFHLSCLGFDLTEEEAARIEFYCDACKARLGISDAGQLSTNQP